MARLDEIDKRYFLMVTPPQDLGNIGDADISRSCDICGEGKSYGRKHRLHLYIKDNYDSASVACFNCGYKGNLYSYLRENHPREYELYKREKAGASFKELKIETSNSGGLRSPGSPEGFKLQEAANNISNIKINTDFIKSDINAIEPTPNLIPEVQGFSPIPEEVVEYLRNRGITPLDNWCYSPKGNSVVFNKKNIYLNEFLIIPLTKSNKWYGFQAVGWKTKRFFVYLVEGNTSWKVWNWFNIDKTKTVYIFESVFDAMSSGLDNCIAQIGTNIHKDRLKELKDPVFCMDNQRCDEASQRESLKYAEKGYKVFIWPEGSERFKDTNDLRKINVPFEKISNMIKNNIYKGIEAVLKLKLLR